MSATTTTTTKSHDVVDEDGRMNRHRRVKYVLLLHYLSSVLVISKASPMELQK